MSCTIHDIDLRAADCLRDFPDASFDGVLCDPPYGLAPDGRTYTWDDLAKLRGNRREDCLRHVLAASRRDPDRAESEASDNLVAFRILVDASLVGWVVDLNNHSPAGKIEVDNEGAVVGLEYELVNEGDAVAPQGIGDEQLLDRKREGAPPCIGSCACFSKHAKSVRRIRVRLQHGTPGEADSPGGVMAGSTAERVAVLSLDLRRRTGELRAADDAHKGARPGLALRSRSVRARPGASGLSAMTEPGRIGDVGAPTDRASAIRVCIAKTAIDRLHKKDMRRVGMMGKAWDAGEPGPTFWREVLRVLKPGAPVLAFGGARTFHRLACAMEDAGFLIDESLCWLYATGMPKSHNISKALDAKAGAVRPIVGSKVGRPGYSTAPNKGAVLYGDGIGGTGNAERECQIDAPVTEDAIFWHGYGTALAPSFEPCVVAWKPFDGTIAANALKHGVGGLNIDGCRLPRDYAERGEAWARSGHSAKPGAGKIAAPPGIGISLHPSGGWPPNVCLDDLVAAELDAWIGERRAGERPARGAGMGYHGGASGWDNKTRLVSEPGGPSRYFFCAKVSRWEREFGCDDLPLRMPGEATEREEGSPGIESGRAGAGRSGDGVRNHGPCLKPIDLTTWLARLILPPARPDRPRRLLVPFAGTGSEMIGARRAGWDEVVGIENDTSYRAIAEARLRRWSQVPAHLSVSDVRGADNDQDAGDPRQEPLFAMGGE